MNDLTSNVFAQLDSSSIESIAGQLGIDPAQASNAIQQALPLLVGGLARNTATPQGAKALHSAIERDHSSVDIGALLGSVLGGASASGSSSGGIADILGSVLGGDSSSPRAASGSDMGGAILGHIFGGRRERASQGLGQTSGLGSAGAAQLMALLAPLVMAAIGKMSREKNMDSNALAGVLGHENNRIQQSGVGGLLNGVLDTDGDGEISMSEMLQAGAGLMGAFGRKR